MKTRAVHMLMIVGLILGWVVLPSNLFAAGAGIETRPVARIPAKRVAPTVYFPNGAATTLTIPSGWGAHSNVVFLGAGITSKQAYSNDDDAGVSFGIGLGDPVEYVGVQLSAAINDVSEGDNWSGGVKLHRYVATGTSLAVGAVHLFPDSESDSDESFYITLSHAVQAYPSERPGATKLNFTVGAGNERFGKKSPRDVKDGKGENGTYVFGAAAYEIFDSTNLVVDWNGLNLNAGVSIAPFRLIPGAEFIPLVVTLGAADLTTYSGDKVRFIASAGLSYKLF